jgi:uncharacterized OB-fold protein
MGAPPKPEIDIESERYWAAVGQHRLELQQCESCGKARFPPMSTCPYCGSRSWHPLEVSGQGEIYSFVTVNQALSAAMAGEVPYTVAVVQLEEGPRMLGRFEPALDVEIGAKVGIFFVDHDDWSEPRFRPRS